MSSSSPEDRYEKQTLFVESLIEFHQDFHPSQDARFTDKEAEQFSQVFEPNWDDYDDDWHVAYATLFGNSPERWTESQRILKKFCELHGVDPGDLLE